MNRKAVWVRSWIINCVQGRPSPTKRLTRSSMARRAKKATSNAWKDRSVIAGRTGTEENLSATRPGVGRRTVITAAQVPGTINTELLFRTFLRPSFGQVKHNCKQNKNQASTSNYPVLYVNTDSNNTQCAQKHVYRITDCCWLHGSLFLVSSSNALCRCHLYPTVLPQCACPVLGLKHYQLVPTQG